MYPTKSTGKAAMKADDLNHSPTLQCEEIENEKRLTSPKINRESGRELHE